MRICKYITQKDNRRKRINQSINAGRRPTDTSKKPRNNSVGATGVLLLLLLYLLKSKKRLTPHPVSHEGILLVAD